MKKTILDFSALIPKGGIKSELTDNILNMTTTRAIHDVGYNIRRDKITSYMLLPGRYHLPMRLDMSIRIDSPEILLLIGSGHISLCSPWMENRRIDDITEPTGKPMTYENHMPLNEFVDISVILNLKQMQILINSSERYFSAKERYMKSKLFPEQNAEGFTVGITCTKRAELSILSASITEYDDNAPITHNDEDKKSKPESQDEPQTTKPTFESCIEGLPEDIKNEIVKTDAFLKSLKNIKFRRTIEKHGNKISYVASEIGISYALYLSGDLMHHSFQWYIITNSKPEHWHRKSNPMETVLEEISKKSPELAERIFYNLNECIGCHEHCSARTPYTYRSQKKITCHGSVVFKMCVSDFQDVREFFSGLDLMPAEKILEVGL